jgi:hypothetical protein
MPRVLQLFGYGVVQVLRTGSVLGGVSCIRLREALRWVREPR